VSDRQGNPLPGANIFLKGTYDGATSDLEGRFSFSTEEQGSQVLLISYISYETQEKILELSTSIKSTLFWQVTLGGFSSQTSMIDSYKNPPRVITQQFSIDLALEHTHYFTCQLLIFNETNNSLYSSI
jgi:hypothetical protein